MVAILIVDNTTPGLSEFTPQLIAFFEQHSEVSVVSTYLQTKKAIETLRFDGIVLSGSSETFSKSVNPEIVHMNEIALQVRVPILGICFGMQVMAIVYGGAVGTLGNVCSGVREVKVLCSTLFERNATIVTRHEHLDGVEQLPPLFCTTAYTGDTSSTIVAFENKTLGRFGVQFHPEASPQNEQVLLTFITYCSRFTNI